MVDTIDATASLPALGTRKRLDHIDAMRPIKQAAVISTHTLIFFAPLAASSTVVGTIMLTRFSRDAFLFVSACMLTFSYRAAKEMKLANYFKRRFLSVGVPYLVWTVVYFVFTSLTPTAHFPYYSMHSAAILSSSGGHYLLHLFFTGYYHLYYLMVIMEFYILFPLLIKLVHRFSAWHPQIMIGVLIWQVAFGVLVSHQYFGFRMSGLLQTRLITSYPIYIIGGMIVALHLDAIHQWICRWAIAIIAMTTLSAIGAEVLNYLGRYPSLPPYLRTGTNIFAPAILPFNVGAILCVYLLGVYLVAPRRQRRTRAAVQSGSDNSYGVYLSQMLWIPILLRVRNAMDIHVIWPVQAFTALVIVYFMGYFFTALVARTRLAKSVVGRSRATWRSLWPFERRVVSLQTGESGDGPMDLTRE